MLGRAAALGCVVGIVASILFGRQGLRARDAIGWIDRSLSMRATVWIAWILLAVPAVAVGARARGTTVLRTLREWRTIWPIAFGILATLVQAPFTLLWWRGAGISRALFATVVAVCIEAALVAGGLFHAIALGLFALVIFVPTIAFLVATALLPFVIRAAWNVTPGTPSTRVSDFVRPKGALFAMLKGTFVAMLRAERARLSVLLAVFGAGVAFLGLSLRNDPPAGSSTRRALLVLTIPATTAAAAVAMPIVRFARTLEWVILVARRSRAWSVATAMLACAAFVAIPVAFVSPIAAVWSSAISALVVYWARRSDRSHPHDGARYAIGVVVIAAMALGSASVASAWSGR